MKDSTRVISMCDIRHEHVWKLTGELAIQRLEADEFLVYVPEKQIGDFRKITPRSIQVLPQESLSKNYYQELYEVCARSGNTRRFGWYLQQFNKIEALRLAVSNKLVIWDSDCVPISKISFYDFQNKAIYMLADEYNENYFKVISNFLGLERVQNQSFVIPGFPIKKEWLHEFIRYVETTYQCSWYEALLKNVDFSLISGFSETETLGTWIANKYPNQMSTCTLNWERAGQSKFGYARNLTVSQIEDIGRVHGLDIVSFENWDLRGLKLFLKKIQMRIWDNNAPQ
jgi:hypothetical protein